MSKSFLKTNIIVLFIANSANVFAYLFQIVIGRHLNIDDFGVFNSINSLGVMATSIVGIVPYVITKFVIELKSDNRYISLLIIDIIKFGLVFSLLFVLIININIHTITNYLHLKDTFPIYILTLIIISHFFMGIFFGIIQGNLMYITSSVKTAVNAISRFAIGFIFVVYLGYNYNGALFATIIANIITALWIFLILNKKSKVFQSSDVKLPKNTYTRMVVYAVPVGLTWFTIGVLTNLDIVLVKHYTSALETGEYSVAAILARIAFFLPAVLLPVLFPAVSQNQKDKKSSFSVLVIVMFITVFFSGIYTIFVYLFPEFIITTLFGIKYIGGSEVMIVITFSMMLTAVLSVIFNFFLANNIYSFLYFSYAVILLFASMLYNINNIESVKIAYIFLFCTISLIFVNLIFAYFKFYYKNK